MSSASSEFPADMSDASLLDDAVYQQQQQQQPGTPVYEYSTYPHSATVTDSKPGWDVLSGLSGSSGYASTTAAAASPQYHHHQQQQQQHEAQRGARHVSPAQQPAAARRMMSPRSNVSTSHMHTNVVSTCTSTLH